MCFLFCAFCNAPFMFVWVFGERLRKAALGDMPVAYRNRRGLAAAGRIRPPPPKHLNAYAFRCFTFIYSLFHIHPSLLTSPQTAKTGYYTRNPKNNKKLSISP